LYLVTAVQKSD